MVQPAGDAVYGGDWDGPGVLESVKFGTTEGDLVSVDISITSDGVWAFTSTRLRVRQRCLNLLNTFHHVRGQVYGLCPDRVPRSGSRRAMRQSL